MKSKLFISFALLFMSINFVYSQQAEHLLFKGVPIDGTLDNFVSKMKSEGFTLVNKASGVAIIKGDFAGYKDCMIGVSILKQKDLVYKIGVIFPSQETWSRLSDNYFFLKETASLNFFLLSSQSSHGLSFPVNQ